MSKKTVIEIYAQTEGYESKELIQTFPVKNNKKKKINKTINKAINYAIKQKEWMDSHCIEKTNYSVKIKITIKKEIYTMNWS